MCEKKRLMVQRVCATIGIGACHFFSAACGVQSSVTGQMQLPTLPFVMLGMVDDAKT